MLREFDTDLSDQATPEANDRPASSTDLGPDLPPQTMAPASPTTSPLNDADAPHGPGFGRVLKNRNFLTLWLGQVFSQLADKVYLVLMIAIISAQFDSPSQSISGWVSAVMVASTIPAVLFGAAAGVFVDRWRKQPVLVLSNLLRGGLVLLLPLGLWATAG